MLEKIKEKLTDGKTVIVGIDGLGGAGKSSISEEIYEQLSKDNIHTEVLHIDDFIHPKNIRYNDNYAEWECYYNLQWRYDYLLENVINPIKKNGKFTGLIELYDKNEDRYEKKSVDIKEGSVVLIEGIFLQREELSQVFDYMIYIDVPESERLTRVLKRDGYIGTADDIKEKYENRYFPAERHYVNMYSPSKLADYVVKG
ncbi:AAA family ATPase [Pseudobutyrivibrio sp.]|uniref:AAA family ATPase n=1 Tax=Pseudobutyrivibrio sp. TaxID=2014367 RepID=UPI0025D914E3|nr:AAA family ATPase [Pseudobutyrivibrio sp.]